MTPMWAMRHDNRLIKYNEPKEKASDVHLLISTSETFAKIYI